MVPDAPSVTLPATDPVAARYRALFATIDWSLLDPAPMHPRRPGPHGVSQRTIVQVLLVKVGERLGSIPRLHQYLLDHPALRLELGVERLPQERQLRRWQQQAAPLLAQVLTQSAKTVAAQVPQIGALVALDATHHVAWVANNNQNQTMAHRFDAAHPPPGDPDCRLGAKTRHPTPFGPVKQAFWGYHSGLMVSTTPGAVAVLAATVTPVVAQEITLAPALQQQVEAVLGAPPASLTADAAFDSVALWDWVVAPGGSAAIALNARGRSLRHTPAGVPLCAQGKPMRPVRHRDPATPCQHYACPLKGDRQATCPDARFARGGCHTHRSASPGGYARRTIDRHSAAYAAAYAKRTTAERIFSQLKSWGLERPIARSLATVQSVLLAGYLLINLMLLNDLSGK